MASSTVIFLILCCRSQYEHGLLSHEESKPRYRLRPDSIGNGHAYSATGVTDASHDTTCSPSPPTQKGQSMNPNNYAAFVAIDWGDKTHAFAIQTVGIERRQTGQIEASAEALHGWLETMKQTYSGRPVALAIEAGRNALIHALVEHPWLEIYPVHPATSARFRKAFTPSGAKDDGPDAESLLTLLALHRDQLTRLYSVARHGNP